MFIAPEQYPTSPPTFVALTSMTISLNTADRLSTTSPSARPTIPPTFVFFLVLSRGCFEIEDLITEQFLNIVEPNDDFATWPTISPIFASSPGFMIIRSIVISSKDDFPSESPTSPPAFAPVELPKLAEIAVVPFPVKT